MNEKNELSNEEKSKRVAVLIAKQKEKNPNYRVKRISNNRTYESVDNENMQKVKKKCLISFLFILIYFPSHRYLIELLLWLMMLKTA